MAEPRAAPPDDAPYPHLFSPIELAGKRLKNRIVHASMTTALAEGDRVGAGQIHYAASRARGGAGAVVMEPLGMIRQHAGAKRIAAPFRADATREESVDGLKRLAEAVEGEDCRIIAQVQDAGRGRHLPGRNFSAIGASALPDDLSWTMPHVLGADEIRWMVDDFAASSALLKRCGFSGVEISAGHGHLFHQFLSPWSNVRTDAYGGDEEGRCRLLAELIAALRGACGSDFIIGLKAPGDDGVAGGIDPELAARIAARLTEGGRLDYVCFAQGAHHRSLEMHIPDGHEPRLTYVPLLRRLRESVGDTPLMALGRITDPAEAEGILAHGDAELVGVGRSIITDAAWPLKASQGRARDIRYCVSGNTCWNTIIHGRPIACDNNPRVGRADEVDWKPQPAPAKRRIAVVGAGVAGMEAAWVAAARGHEVTLFGRSAEVGGKTRLHALLPGGEGLSSIYDYQHQEAIRAGVRFELGREAGVDEVLEVRPDEVVLATGSTMIRPRWLPETVWAQGLAPDLRDAAREFLHRPGRQRGTAVVFDMDHTEGTYAAAEHLHAVFDRVVVVTPRASVAEDAPPVTRQGVMRRLHAKRIAIVPLAEPVWSDALEAEGRLELRHAYGVPLDPIEDVALITYATPRAPDDALAGALRARGLPVRLVGDCRVANDRLAATADGHAAGEAV